MSIKKKKTTVRNPVALLIIAKSNRAMQQKKSLLCYYYYYYYFSCTWIFLHHPHSVAANQYFWPFLANMHQRLCCFCWKNECICGRCSQMCRGETLFSCRPLLSLCCGLLVGFIPVQDDIIVQAEGKKEGRKGGRKAGRKEGRKIKNTV